MRPRDFERDVAARMRGADDQNRSVLQLLRVAVFARVQLQDRGVEFVREIGNGRGPSEGAGGHHDVARDEPRSAALDEKPVVGT